MNKKYILDEDDLLTILKKHFHLNEFPEDTNFEMQLNIRMDVLENIELEMSYEVDTI